MNHTATTPTYNETHDEPNRPKLQWLILLIPVVGAFLIYTWIQIKNKARARRPLDDEENTMVALTVTDTTISAPSPIYRRQMFDMRSNERRRAAVAEPLIGLSNVGNTMIWQRLQDTGDPRRMPTPPPVYSVSSPPKYDEVIALENDETSTRT